MKSNILYPSLWRISVIIWINFIVTASKYGLTKETTQCAGRKITLDCFVPDLLIHIQYERYAYNSDSTSCAISVNSCTSVEFLNPVSLPYCTGRPSCSYNVPDNKVLTTCNQNATTVAVLYQCVAKSKIHDMCMDFLYTNIQTIYFTTPNYPSQILDAMQCSCEITGQEVNITIMEHFKAPLSRVAFYMMTNKGTKHITNNRVINVIEYSNISKVEINMYNEMQNEIFRIWLRITAKEVQVKCGAPVLFYPTSTVELATQSSLPSSIYNDSITKNQSVLATTTNRGDKTSSVSNISSSSTMELQSSSMLIEESSFKTTGLHSSSMMTELSTLKTQTPYVKASSSSSSSSSVSSLEYEQSTSTLTTYSTASVYGNSDIISGNTTSDNNNGNSNGDSSEWILIVAVTGSLCFIMFILIIIVAVLIFRARNTHNSGSYVNPDTNEDLHGYDGPQEDVHF